MSAALGIPVATQCPEILITAQSYGASPHHLANVGPEALLQQTAFGGPEKAEVMSDINVVQLNDALRGRKVLCFAGHGDAPLLGETVPGFVDAGGLQAVSISTLVEVIRAHVLKGYLQMVVFTGCCTLELAKALHERALVPFCVCWASVLSDAAGPAFGAGFASSYAAGETPLVDFDAACTAVHMQTEPGYLDGAGSTPGLESSVQKYELWVDPKDAALVFPKHHPDAGRLRSFPAGAHRGRIAAGVPKLIQLDPPRGVDPLPATYVPRPEQLEMRNALVAGIRKEGVVVSLVGSSEKTVSAVSGISGTPGLGKTTTARWLCRDLCVRVAFRDGIHWLEFGQRRTAGEVLSQLARSLGMAVDDIHKLERRGSASLCEALAERVQGKHHLIVLDDVWNEDQPKPFAKLADGGVVVLMTTRKSYIVDAYGEELSNLKLHPFEDSAAVKLLVASSGKSHDDLLGRHLDKLVTTCAGLPAMLRSVGRMCRKKSAEAVCHFFDTHKLDHRLPREMARADGYQQDAAQGNLFLAFEGQLNGLEEEGKSELVEQCTMLAVFPEDTSVPLDILSDLWGTDAAETSGVVEHLACEGLVELEDGDAEGFEEGGLCIRLLDPVRDYLGCRGKSALAGWHARLLGACKEVEVGFSDHDHYWSAGSRYYWCSGYAGYHHFAHHLNGCNGKLGVGMLGEITYLNCFDCHCSYDAEVSRCFRQLDVCLQNAAAGMQLDERGIYGLLQPDFTTMAPR